MAAQATGTAEEALEQSEKKKSELHIFCNKCNKRNLQEKRDEQREG